MNIISVGIQMKVFSVYYNLIFYSFAGDDLINPALTIV